ncbi:MAG: 1-(5-phosphoribosyl)-5-[(5-phosphoribosylamino)methylideneamino]imidazole-4-carboxamide isomerase [Planctomycetota bacterium]|jgi:phosphoribosylformimino-5-aminoimidazole carboxamide ribotide isomerase|nr:1-(5-phosphoribosyl)-5-[(5-phosphoribosylamino)methylideneamino]imidazole-4-carboxamide isomerase [Planctomycetota bacterium]
MDVIPAIDLRDGKVVRLIQGQYDRQITYRDDPAEQARQFHADGARWLHIVDLDGAKAGRPVNTASIEAIVCLGLLKVEVGGGLRDEASIAQLLDMGVTRVIIGTKAVSDFDWFSRMAEKFAGRIVLGLDARGSMVATHGWLEDSQQTVLEFAARADELPLAAIIYTDIAKDGMLTGPNLERTQALAEAVKTPVVASGGVKEADDIRRLHPIGVAGVIVGRSLYEGTLTLPDAIAAAK